MTAASNLIGTRPDLPAIAEIVHAAGALLWVDGVHATAHVLTDVPASGADFWVCSPYKFLGPHLGVLARLARAARDAAPRQAAALVATPCPSASSSARCPTSCSPARRRPSTSSPTSPSPTPRGRAASDSSPRSPPSRTHEDALLATLEARLRAIPGLTAYSNAQRRTPTVLVTVEGHDPQDLRTALAERGVNAPAGSFYAWECSHHLGLGASGGLRMGLAPYTNADDVDRLATGLEEICGVSR